MSGWWNLREVIPTLIVKDCVHFPRVMHQKPYYLSNARLASNRLFCHRKSLLHECESIISMVREHNTPSHLLLLIFQTLCCEFSKSLQSASICEIQSKTIQLGKVALLHTQPQFQDVVLSLSRANHRNTRQMGAKFTAFLPLAAASFEFSSTAAGTGIITWNLLYRSRNRRCRGSGRRCGSPCRDVRCWYASLYHTCF